MAYCLHVQVVLSVAEGKPFAETDELCLRARKLSGEAAEKPYAFLAASLNNEGLMFLLPASIRGRSISFDEAGYDWTNAGAATTLCWQPVG